MSFITIKPLLKLLAASEQRSHLTVGDLNQLENKVTNILKMKAENPEQAHSSFVEQRYLKIINLVREKFTGRDKFSRAELIAETDRVLRENNFYNYSRVMPPAVEERVFYDSEKPPVADYKSYDLAFYNPQSGSIEEANPQAGTHHRDPETHKPSLYYVRCEKLNETMIIGNLQVDTPHVDKWADPLLGKIMTRRPNVYLSMIQQTLAHARAVGCTKIIFQAEDAMEYAQWRDAYDKEVLITPDNIAQYERQYQRACERFAAARVGDFPIHDDRDTALICAKTPTQYTSVYINNSYINCSMAYTLAALARFCIINDCTIDKEMAAANLCLQNQQPAQLLEHIDRMFATAFINTESTGPAPPKIQYLKKLCAAQKMYSDNGRVNLAKNINQFLTKFNYPEAFIAQYPQFTKITNPRPTGADNAFYLVDTQTKNNLEVFKLADLEKPVVGKIHKVSKHRAHDFLYRDSTYYTRQLDKIAGWYRRDLPKILTGLNLGVKRVPLTNGTVNAHGWEITSGLERFDQTPLAVFAHHAELKLDCETLPRLTTAAQKFGLTPAQMEVINARLATPAGMGVGRYDPAADKITLSNHSLAILAHECLHRLHHRGLIAPQDYQSLVAAGKAVVNQNKELRRYIQQTNPAGNYVYPPGPARDSEYAAVFVENYYTAPTAARKNLTGQKLTIWERVLEYIKEVRDLLQSVCGNQPARARGFLRRVENNYYAGRRPAHYSLRPVPAPAKSRPAALQGR